MADADFTSIGNNELFVAQCHFEGISGKLEKIQTVALLLLNRMRDVPEDNRDIISINTIELIESMAGEAEAVYALDDFFKKYRGEHESEASHA